MKKVTDPTKTVFNTSQKKTHNKIIEQIAVSDMEVISKLYPKCNIVFLEDRIYDIEGLDHPGGSFIFKKIKGRELSRYFFG